MNDVCKLNIEGRIYGLRKMSPIEGAPFGLKVFSTFSKILMSPAVADIAKSLGDLKDKKDLTQVETSEAIRLGLTLIPLLSCLNPDEVTAVFKKAVDTDVFIGEDRLADDDVFHKHFQQYPGDYYPVAIWATWSHVRDFFTGIGAGMKALMGGLPASQVQFPSAK